MTQILRIDELEFRWPGSKELTLKIPSFSVSAGEKIFLQGPSGSGKSTLLNLIGGVLAPQKGRIEILGKDLTELSPEARDRFRGDHMGFIFQMFNLLPYFSAVENVILPCEFSKYKSTRALSQTDSLQDEALRILTGLQLNTRDLAGKKVNQLSVGQQQRVAAARALIGRPELIIADEPTSALDTDAQSGFLDLLFSECKKSEATLIFVSHDKSLGCRFDRHLHLSEINRVPLNNLAESKDLL